jgi:nucleotide-binding universal stress UspA family protein
VKEGRVTHVNGSPSTTRRAILATDGSAHARAATAFAGALAWPAGAVVSVASVVEAPNPGDLPISHWEERALADWRMILEHGHAAAREQALASISEAAGVLRARHPSIGIDEVVRVGEPAAELLALAREADAELVIAGARGRTVLECLLLGSVSEALVTEAPCPVLIVREAVAEIGVVLVALRTPDDADRLAGACLRLPLPPATRLIAATASAPLPAGSPTARPFAPGQAEALFAAWDEAERAGAEAAGERFVERMRAGDPRRDVTARVVRGELRPSAFEARADVAPALLAEAAALGADLIVVGAREQPGVAARLGLGSVSRKLVRRAPMAVLVVRGAPAPA